MSHTSWAAIRLLVIPALLWGQLLIASERVSEGVKLAIITTDPCGDGLADGLTAKLSNSDGVTLLEREEISRIVREQKLGVMNSASLLKAGGLSGADGLVVIDPRKLAGSIDVKLRLVGVQRGVALGWWAKDVPSGQVLSWSEGAARQIEQLLPKLRVGEKFSKPLSFVGFSSPSVSPSTVEFERTINSLLLSRLGAEPDLLVLERQRLLDAAFEKTLSATDREFWNGGYIVQGTLNPERISSDFVTVRFSLASPDSSSREITITSSRTNLAGLAQQFVAEVRKVLNSDAPDQPWDRLAEAERFYQHAQNALRFQFWLEARAAAETALALGKDDIDARAIRLRACVELFRTDEGRVLWESYMRAIESSEAMARHPLPWHLMQQSMRRANCRNLPCRASIFLSHHCNR